MCSRGCVKLVKVKVNLRGHQIMLMGLGMSTYVVWHLKTSTNLQTLKTSPHC
jgi:hypothetical protein